MGIERYIRSIHNWGLGGGSEGKKEKLFQIPNTHRISRDGHAISCNPSAVRGGERNSNGASRIQVQ